MRRRSCAESEVLGALQCRALALSRFSRSSISKNPGCPRMLLLRIHPTRWNQKMLPIDQVFRTVQLAVERLPVAVLPWTARLDVERSGTEPGQPAPDHFSGHLRSVVRTNV